MVPVDNSSTAYGGDDQQKSHKKKTKKLKANNYYAALPGIFRRRPITTTNLSVTNSKNTSTANKLKEAKFNEMIITDEEAFQIKLQV